MGGVDLFDQLVSYYRIFIKSRKWTLRLIFHAVDFAIAQSWLEYRKDAVALKIPSKEILDLLDFRIRVSSRLTYVNKLVNGKKQGLPSSSPSPSAPVVQRRRGETRPSLEIQFDHIDHLPFHDDADLPSRCKFPKCTGRSRIFCKKCGVHLCLMKGRNCFAAFHTK